MNKNKLIKRALLDALGVIAYLFLFSFVLNSLNRWVGSKPDNNWLAPVFFLSMFIVSACVTASLVLLKPILLYLEDHKKDAVSLFLYTIGFLALMGIIVGIFIIIFT